MNSSAGDAGASDKNHPSEQLDLVSLASRAEEKRRLLAAARERQEATTGPEEPPDVVSMAPRIHDQDASTPEEAVALPAVRKPLGRRTSAVLAAGVIAGGAVGDYIGYRTHSGVAGVSAGAVVGAVGYGLAAWCLPRGDVARVSRFGSVTALLGAAGLFGAPLLHLVGLTAWVTFALYVQLFASLPSRYFAKLRTGVTRTQVRAFRARTPTRLGRWMSGRFSRQT
jgi:hypothetical protein